MHLLYYHLVSKPSRWKLKITITELILSALYYYRPNDRFEEIKGLHRGHEEKLDAFTA